MICTRYSTKKKYREHCLIMALINMRCLRNIVERMETVNEDLQLTVTEVRDCAATLKGKKSYEKKPIMEAFHKAVNAFIDENYKEFSEIVESRYEFAFEKDMIDSDFIEDFVDLSRHGKYIYLDIDV